MTEPSDPFGLQRFVDAQSPVFETVLRELRVGRKAGHWMWFVFPQIAGLGSSPMAQRYAIGSLDEAHAYFGHPVLGPRLKACVAGLLDVSGRSAHEIFGSPDDVKLRSSLTLFAAAAPDEPLFMRALDRFFDGRKDAATLERL